MELHSAAKLTILLCTEILSFNLLANGSEASINLSNITFITNLYIIFDDQTKPTDPNQITIYAINTNVLCH